MPPSQEPAETLQRAQLVLSQHLHGEVKLEAGLSLRGSDRSHVLRCRVVDAPSNSPTSVIVKRALAQGDEVYDPISPDGPAVRLFNEWASLQFLGECFGSDSPIPHLYGGDREVGLLVMEDMGAGQGLDALLLGEDALPAENALLQLFQVMGRMHAVSCGKAARFDQLRQSLGPTPPNFMSAIVERRGWLQESVQTAGLAVHPQLDSDIDGCIEQFLEPGPFQTLVHGDPCPDNCLVTGQGLKLLDFEFAQFGQALWDGAYARSHFPTCWCVNDIPSALIERAEGVYREELVHGCQQAADDQSFGRAVVASCAMAVLRTLPKALTDLMPQDWEWGIATYRQRVLVRLNALHGACQRWNQFLVLGDTAHQLKEALAVLWLPEIEEMPMYPAFREAAGGSK